MYLGAIYAVISFMAATAPKATFLIFGIIPMPAWGCVVGLFTWDLLNAVSQRVCMVLWNVCSQIYQIFAANWCEWSQPSLRHHMWHSIFSPQNWSTAEILLDKDKRTCGTARLYTISTSMASSRRRGNPLIESIHLIGKTFHSRSTRAIINTLHHATRIILFKEISQ